MDYLFFDIECANCDGGNGKICSFGYVITDEEFNIIKMEDLVINPKAPFRLRNYGKDVITLAYSKEEFNKAPTFDYYYDYISTLLGKEDRMIFGYAPENDAAFLRSEFERYKLKKIDFYFYDVSRLLRNIEFKDEKNTISLSKACEKLEINNELEIHKSSDDALATALILKHLVNNYGQITELIENYKPSKGYMINGEIGADYFKPKVELSAHEMNHIKGVNKDNFRYLLRRLAEEKHRGPLYGKRICFSATYEYYHYTEMMYIVKKINELGGQYSNKLSSANLFILKPRNIKSECKRRISIDNMILNNEKNIPDIETFEKFMQFLKIDLKTLTSDSKEMLEYLENLKKS